ncbi:hypothetical protein BD769DRAFT_1392572 [Suillus cothurnatus]|nr:hypothetical protein BD769DRAFT_1392572 [Suillus cothurnatus]
MEVAVAGSGISSSATTGALKEDTHVRLDIYDWRILSHHLDACTIILKGERDLNTNAAVLYGDINHLPEDLHDPILATLNPPADSDVTKTAARFAYDHHILDTKAIIARKAVMNIKGRGGVLFAKAWIGCGFHEDNFTSGWCAVANHSDSVQLP